MSTLNLLPFHVLGSYTMLRELPDGRVIGVHRLMYHWTMHVDIDPSVYRERYCFATLELAKRAFDTWDGVGDPEGWHRHPESGRRRPDGDPNREYVAW